jgi:hypothetical protein
MLREISQALENKHHMFSFMGKLKKKISPMGRVG